MRLNQIYVCIRRPIALRSVMIFVNPVKSFIVSLQKKKSVGNSMGRREFTDVRVTFSLSKSLFYCNQC